jgi:hypothetical protein
MATATFRQSRGTNVVAVSTGATLTSTSRAIGSAVTYSETNPRRCLVEYQGSTSGSPTAGTGLAIWFVRAQLDGSGDEDGGSSVTPARAPDVVLPLRNASGAQVVSEEAWLPAGSIKVLVLNDGTGQTLQTGWLINLQPVVDTAET